MKRLLAAVLFFGLVGGLRGSPFFNQQLLGAGTGADPGQVSFDAGPVDSCEVPTTCVCGVEYEVPSSVATIAAAIEMDIDSTYDSNFEILHGASCRNATRRIVCAQRFPRCVTREDGTKQVELTSLQCAEELTNQCSPGADLDRLMERTCGVEDSTRDIGECRSVAQYAAESYELGWFEQCTLSDRWQVTAWMYGYLKYYELAAREATRDLDYSAVCLERLANFTCQWIGRCSASGDSVELINTHQFCEQTINCFSDTVADNLRDRYDCQLWPEVPTDVPPDTEATASTGTSGTTTTDSGPTSMTPSTSMPVWPTIDVGTSPIGGSLTLRGSGLWTLTLAAITALILHHL